MVATDERAGLADRLWRAELFRAPVEPLIVEHPELDASDAYRIQLANISRRLAAGGVEVAGHKVGLSSEAMQRMMGVDEPDYGHLLTDMALSEDVPVVTEHYCWPRIEVEVGFLLGEDVPAEGCDEAGVLARTEALVPAIELIDSRIAGWRISLPDTIADNASSAGYILGSARIDPTAVNVKDIDASLWRGNEGRDEDLVEQGRSDAVLGDPATAVAWLARTVADFGVRLRAGNLVLPGSCTRAIDVSPDQCYRAEFRSGGVELGSVSVAFE